MKLVRYKKTVTLPLRQVTLCLLVKEGEILLAMKKRGFGKGKWNGVGGKLDEGEKIEEAAIREAKEEIGVTPTSFRRVATLNFYFPHQPDWHQQVCVFLVDKWEGKPTESEEMNPQWFKQKEIPFDSMWPDDPIWLPKVLGGLCLEGDFLFGENEEMLDFKVSEI